MCDFKYTSYKDCLCTVLCDLDNLKYVPKEYITIELSEKMDKFRFGEYKTWKDFIDFEEVKLIESTKRE